MVRQAVILAGGKGTRLGERTKAVPKPVLSVGGVPFLSHLVWNLARHGITEIVVSSGYLHDKLREELGDGRKLGVQIVYVREGEPLGTGGGVRNCLHVLDDAFLVLNGDSIFDINYLDLAVEAGGEACVALRGVEDVSRYGAVRHEGGRVIEFSEKGGRGPGAINGGVYLLTRELVQELAEGVVSLEQDVFPGLVRQGRLFCREYSGFFIDIGVPEDLERAQVVVPAWRRKPALFLDRDGVLNVNHGYVHEQKDLDWCQGAREAIKAANDAGWLVVVVSNQSGIGRGYYSEEAFHRFMDIMSSELADVGGHFDAVYHCPHHPEGAKGEYLRQCDCRKPEPGMLLAAERDWGMDMAASVMIGDSPSDIEAGRRAGVGRCLLYDHNRNDLSRLVYSLL